MIVIVIILYLSVIVFDLVPLIKSGKKKDYWVYSIFLAVSFCILILYLLNVKVPSPSIIIQDLIEKVFKVES